MPSRALTEGQLEDLFALPAVEPDLIRHWTLSETDLATTGRRRGDGNQLGYALQLCAFRYPGRLLRPGNAIPVNSSKCVSNTRHLPVRCADQSGGSKKPAAYLVAARRLCPQDPR